ncbi:follicle cell protein 3C-1 [Manduca sexta]|uniref:Follicle cell protein 3C-1 n=1 Tax=Manduca sexta TaxID=7130 RepID=A0A921Z7I7_MANSE|nr:follicle cell protein 3C-1 [Manduca sexta]XP_030027053.1 follicle cell protein 3C-1 [Manduca sexta]KAG6452684.1 hypothetical protein O3G_MSEX007733 [Manduca sexta]
MKGIRGWALLAACLWLLTLAEGRRKLKRHDLEDYKSAEDVENGEDYDEVEPCQCGVFMSQQVGIKEGRRSKPRGPPQGEPVVTYDTDAPSLPCGSRGFKSCISTCLDVILQYLPKAGPVICGAVERDVYRERAFLFIKNCGGDWTATSFSAGKEFCCVNGKHEKC